MKPLRGLSIPSNRLISGLALLLIAQLAVIPQAYLLAQVVERVFLEHRGPKDFLSLLLVLVGARALFLFAGSALLARSSASIQSELRERLFEHLLRLGPCYVQGERQGELASLVLEGIDGLEAWILRYLPALMSALVLPWAILVMIAPQDLLSALLLVLTLPLIPLFMILIGRWSEDVMGRQWGALTRMAVEFLEVLRGLPTLKLFGRERATLDEVREVAERYRKTTLSVLRVAFLSSLALELLATLSTAILAVEIGLRLLEGKLPFFPAYFILLLIPEFYGPLRQLGAQFHATQPAQKGFEALQRVLATPLPTPRPSRPPSSLDLRLEKVTFGYPKAPRPLFEEVDLEIPFGSSLVLMGPSGSGKSTLLALLMGFLEPQGGQIWVGDLPLNALDPKVWRSYLTYVPQRPYFFHGSILENLRIARPHASLREIEEAADQAGARAFIEALPQGYATLLGEGGLRLSGGELQRLALTRALLKETPLLILDEPLAHLDLARRDHLQATLRALAHGRTLLLASHDPVPWVRQIVRITGGRLVLEANPSLEVP